MKIIAVVFRAKCNFSRLCVVYIEKLVRLRSKQSDLGKVLLLSSSVAEQATVNR